MTAAWQAGQDQPERRQRPARAAESGFPRRLQSQRRVSRNTWAAGFLRILDARHPVNGILDQRRHRRIIFRRNDQHAHDGAPIMRLRLICVLRHARSGLQIAVIDRQRKSRPAKCGVTSAPAWANS